MVQINMRVFKIISLLLSILTLTRSSPVSSLRLEHREAPDDDVDTPTTPRPVISPEDSYDQRQNGTENYRIHVDGLVVVVAPVEALLLAGGIPDNFSSILVPPAPEKPLEKPLEKPQDDLEPLKPIEKPNDGEKPLEVKKISHRGNLKLISFLAPLLRHLGRQ
ncbi:uncharacterized protein [Fopius arisanus]|uniref:Uncharacterized protein n=1 Tax=Fopius arisanus TaxID=64838 RepID=A0A9R1TGD4_9HYME|nr:PREDICTED: uncharacterized protein LOC105269952 [Fopius arisanus]